DHLRRSSHSLTFDVELADDGQVDSVALRASTLHDDGLAACMAHALRALSVDDLPMRRAEDLPRGPVAPQARALLGHPLARAACVAELPVCPLALGIVAGAMGAASYFGVQIYVPAPAHPGTMTHPHPPAVATAAPTATAVPTTTAIPRPRRYPNQTC